MPNRAIPPIALLIQVPLWLWTGAVLVLDYLGRATIIGDLAKPDTVSAQVMGWLLNTPWWTPSALATLVTAVWLLVMMRHLRPSVPPLPMAALPEPRRLGSGGTGGSGTILGNHGVIVGGRGGNAGTGGTGGDGGSGVATGDHGYIQGGDGGNAGAADGRGGKATAPAPQLASLPMQVWGAGRGGFGGNAPEYERRLNVLIAIRSEYMDALPDTRPFILAGIDQIAPDWINARLANLGETWRVELGREGYVLPSLQVGQG